MQPLKPLYQKMDRCIRLLEELNSQMRDLRRQNAKAKASGKQSVEAGAGAVAESEKFSNDKPVISDAGITESKKEPCREEASESVVAQPAVTIERGFNVDKCGRVYTEEEIRKLIAD